MLFDPDSLRGHGRWNTGHHGCPSNPFSDEIFTIHIFVLYNDSILFNGSENEMKRPVHTRQELYVINTSTFLIHVYINHLD